MGFDFHFTSNLEEFKKLEEPKLVYDLQPINNALFLCSKDLLFENDIRHQDIQFIEVDGIPCPFPVYNEKSMFKCDILAASFYLVSRYEEYLPYKKDQHHRFIASESLAFEKKFLRKPVINIWAQKLKTIILASYPNIESVEQTYRFIPTYDIDIAWSFRNKGFTRNTGGFLRDLFKLNFNDLNNRIMVLLGHRKDPYDTYELQKSWAKEYQLQPIYFILFGELGPYDKNISTINPNLHTLIKDLLDHAQIGIHPSYESNENTHLLQKEIKNLGETIHVDITKSRQHFLKLHLPVTYRNLLSYGIEDDYTMGYASEVGFRASICTSFNFYDLDLETETKLRVHPFAIMDGTLRDYMKTSPEEARSIISEIVAEVKKVDGQMISLWHNESLNNQGKWENWQKVYDHLLKVAAK